MTYEKRTVKLQQNRVPLLAPFFFFLYQQNARNPLFRPICFGTSLLFASSYHFKGFLYIVVIARQDCILDILSCLKLNSRQEQNTFAMPPCSERVKCSFCLEVLEQVEILALFGASAGSL